MNKTLYTAYTGLPVFLTEAKINFFDTTENLHGSKLAKRILFCSDLYLNANKESAILMIFIIINYV